MGIQINIAIPELLKAGWKLRAGTEEFEEQYDPENPPENPIVEVHEYLIISKGGYEFHSYCLNTFCADCNEWGLNIEKFRRAGLLDIPHILA